MPNEPIAHLVWLQGRRAADDVEDYYEVARPGDKSVDGSDPFPVYRASPSDAERHERAIPVAWVSDNDPISWDDGQVEAYASKRPGFKRPLFYAAAVQEPVAVKAAWQDMATAPKDGTILRLLIVPDGDEFTPFDDSLNPYETIGFNNLVDTMEDRWEFAGWDWSQDCFITGRGEVIGWCLFTAQRSDPLKDAVEWCLDRDSRNGSLPEAYAEKLRSALSTSQSNPSPEKARDCGINGGSLTEHQDCIGKAYTESLARGLMFEARISLIARTIRNSLRKYGHKTAESVLPECIAADVERTLVAAATAETTEKAPEIAALRAENERLRGLRNTAECVVIAQHDERLGTAIERLDAALEAAQNARAAVAPDQEEAK